MSEALTTADLVRNVACGDRDTLERLLLDNYDFLHRHIQGNLVAHSLAQSDAEDIVQEVHVKAFQHIEQFRGNSIAAFRAWLIAIAENCVRNLRRDATRMKRSGKLQRVRYLGGNQDSLVEFVEMLSGRDGNPPSLAAMQEAVRAIRVGIAHLPADQRDAIDLYHMQGMNLTETAAEMSKTEGAVRGLLRRAKLHLRDALGRSSQWLSGE